MQHKKNKPKSGGEKKPLGGTAEYSVDDILMEARALRGTRGKDAVPAETKGGQGVFGAPSENLVKRQRAQIPPPRAETAKEPIELPPRESPSPAEEAPPAPKPEEEKLYFETEEEDIDFSGLSEEAPFKEKSGGFFQSVKKRFRQKREEKDRDELIEHYERDPIKPMSETSGGKYTGEITPTFGYLFDDGVPSEEPAPTEDKPSEEFSSVFDKLMVEKRRQTVEQLFLQHRPGEHIPHGKKTGEPAEDIDTETIVFEIDDADLGKTTQFSVIREEDLELFADGEIPSGVIEEPDPIPTPEPTGEVLPASAPDEAAQRDDQGGPAAQELSELTLTELFEQHAEELAAPDGAFLKDTQEEPSASEGPASESEKEEPASDQRAAPQTEPQKTEQAGSAPAEALSSPFIDDLRPEDAEKGVQSYPTDGKPEKEPSAQARREKAKPGKPEEPAETGDAEDQNLPGQTSLFTDDSQSRYERHFGKVSPASPGTSAETLSRVREKRQKKSEKAPLYRKEGEKMLVVVGKFKDTLIDECAQSGAARTNTAEDPAPAPKKGRRPMRKKKAETKEEPIPIDNEEQQTRRPRFHLFGEVEEDNDDTQERKSQPLDEIDDYEDPSDIQSVRSDLFINTRKLFVRLIATAFLALFAVAFAVIDQLNPVFLHALKDDVPSVIPIIHFVLLGLSCAFSYVTIASGLRSLFKLRANSDSALAFAAVAAAVQAAVAVFLPAPFINGGLHLYSSLVALGLFLNTWGKFLMVRRTSENFKFVSSPDQKRAVRLVGDKKLSQELYRGVDGAQPVIAYQTRVKFLTDFLKLSYEPDPCEKLSIKAAPFGALLSLAVAVVSYFTVLNDVQSALAALTVTAVMSVPMCGLLCINRPLIKLCKKALRKGAMLIGAPGVRQFCDVNAVVLRDTDLYPNGSVKLHGIKTFSGNRIDEVILDAAAMMKEVGGPISSTFDDIIKGKKDILPKVDSVNFEDDKGLVGWVRTRRTLIGNRNLMLSHGITPPSLDYEEKYKKGGRQITYLASAGDLVAMFITSYTPSPSMVYELEELEDHGVSFLIETQDSNITEKFIAAQFGVYIKSVKILPQKLCGEFEETTAAPEKRVRGYLATRMKTNALSKLITACIRMKGSMTISVILQAVSVLLGFLLVAFLVFYAGLSQLGALELLIYQAFWILAILIVPALRKPM